MDPRTIRAMEQEQANRAAAKGVKPLMAWPGDHRPSMRIPNIGSHCPKGWELVQEYFVDKSGMGAEDEPALTIDQFLGKVQDNMGYAIVEEGQFQLYVGEFRRNATPTEVAV